MPPCPRNLGGSDLKVPQQDLGGIDVWYFLPQKSPNSVDSVSGVRSRLR